MDAPTSNDSNNENGTSNKKSKTSEAGPTATLEQRQPHSLLALPDAASECMCSFLRGTDILNLSTVSKTTKEDYGGRMIELTLRWRDHVPASSFFTLLHRQESLRSIILASASKLLPCLIAPLARNDLSHLRVLELNGSRLSISCLSALAGVITQGAVPLLERFDIARYEKSGLDVIMEPFKAGACLYLHTLYIPIPFYDTIFDEDGDEHELDGYNDEQTDKDVHAIAETLEARKDLGITGLKKLQGGDWLDYGTVEVRTRLLRVLLPSLEQLPDIDDYDNWEEDFAAVFDEVGAPQLKKFVIPAPFPPLVAALRSMTSLTALIFAHHSLDNACTDRFIDLLEQHGSILLPQLEVLDLAFAFTGPVDATRFFTCVAEQGALASVKELRMGGDYGADPNSGFCPSSVLSEGAFAGVQRLNLRRTKFTQESIVAFCQALEGSPCIKNVTLLNLEACDISGPGMVALGGLFAKSLLPSLQELVLNDNPAIADSGLVRLAIGVKMAGMQAAPALKKLVLSKTGMGPVGFKALLSVVEVACFPVLEELELSYNPKLNDGFDCLSQAIQAGYLSNLRKLALGKTELKSSKDAAALATAILMHCPKMITLSFPAELGATGRLAIRGVLQERKKCRLSFW